MRWPFVSPLLGGVLAVSGCGGSNEAVVEVLAYDWPGRPSSGLVAGIKPGDVPLGEVESAIPDPLPDNPERQICDSGVKVEITFEDGRTITYGPCRRPASIERLRRALNAASR